MKFIVAASVLFVSLISILDSSIKAEAKQPTERSCDNKPISFHIHRAKALINDAYSFGRWQDTSPAKDREKKAWQEHKACVRDASERKKIEKHRASKDRKFSRYHKLRQVTPYKCVVQMGDSLSYNCV